MGFEKRDELIDEGLCDHCLGRQFAELSYGLENWERGAIIRSNPDFEEDDLVKENVPDNASIGGDCFLCDGVFNRLDEFVNMIIDAVSSYDFNSILIGTRPSKKIKEKEKKFWGRYGDEYSEPIKSELNRLIGKRVQSRLDVSVDFKRPDINAVLDLEVEDVELQVNSMLLYGQYNKYSREIPQTVWPCYNCGGSGCEECDYTGKTYQESVQEIIQESFIDAANADDGKFHGAGREDIDAKCFGRREFVLELMNPKTRDIDIKKIQTELNNSQDKVEVFEMQTTHKDKIKELKTKRADKTYRATVELSKDIPETELQKLNNLVGTIEQETPQRVDHRRASKTRKRKIHNIEYEKIGEGKIELKVKAEAGTYIKEMISGDENRTKPSVSELLNLKAECTELDVINIEK